MNLSVRQLALKQLKAFPPEVRLVIIHPNFLHQHTLLSVMLDDALYVRFEGSDLGADDLKDQLMEAAASHADKRALDGFASVICDELDRARPQAMDAFIRSLLQQFTGRIIVFTRSASAIPLQDASVRLITRFLPVSDTLMLWDYAQRNPASGTLLEVRAFGEGRVQLEGKDIVNWDGVLPRALFFFLVDRGMVTRGEIFQTFWANLPVREATNVFHVTKRKISEVLGMDLTKYEAGFYYISRSIHLSYDVSMFTQLLQDSAVMSLQQAAETAHQALMLYRRDFLTSVDMLWAERRRADLRQMYSEALVVQSRMTEQLGDQSAALGLMLQASGLAPQREDVVYHIMRLYNDLNRPAEALDVFRRLEAELRSTLDLAPGANLRDLAAQIEQSLSS